MSGEVNVYDVTIRGTETQMLLDDDDAAAYGLGPKAGEVQAEGDVVGSKTLSPQNKARTSTNTK